MNRYHWGCGLRVIETSNDTETMPYKLFNNHLTVVHTQQDGVLLNVHTDVFQEKLGCCDYSVPIISSSAMQLISL